MQKPSTRLSDQIAERIQQLIQEHTMQPGDRLPSERDLAELFGVSRPPIREAIRMLASQGLLMTKRGGGTYVQTNDLNWPTQTMAPLGELMSSDPFYRYDVLEARHALESSTAWHAAQRATQQDKDHIQRCFDNMLEHQKSGNADLSAKADARFHLAIAEASHNVVLLQVMQGLFKLVLSTVEENRRTMFRFNDPKTIEQLTAQHEALMHAIFEGDSQKASQAIGHHLNYVDQNIRAADEDEARRQRSNRFPILPPIL